jgi:hypothetical protein
MNKTKHPGAINICHTALHVVPAQLSWSTIDAAYIVNQPLSRILSLRHHPTRARLQSLSRAHARASSLPLPLSHSLIPRFLALRTDALAEVALHQPRTRRAHIHPSQEEEGPFEDALGLTRSVARSDVQGACHRKQGDGRRQAEQDLAVIHRVGGPEGYAAFWGTARGCARALGRGRGREGRGGGGREVEREGERQWVRE